MESFFHTLKTELVHHRDYLTRDEARRDIFEYIEVFYNRQRRHSTIASGGTRHGVIARAPLEPPTHSRHAKEVGLRVAARPGATVW